MTKMSALARELHDALEKFPLDTKQISEMFRKHGDKNRVVSDDLTELDNLLARYGRYVASQKKRHQTRPEPTKYLPEDYVNKHRDQFKDGVSRFQGADGYFDRGHPFQKDGTSFVLPSKEVDEIVERARGEDGVIDINLIEEQLGLPRGTFEGGPIVIVDFPNAKPEHLDLASGNEDGANEHWNPFGETSGGVPEAVIRSDSAGAEGHHARLRDGQVITIGGASR